MKIAIRMPNWVGDVVMATPFLKGVRHHFPESHITLWMRPHLIPLLEGNSWVQEIRPLRDKGLSGPFQAGFAMRKEKFDLAFILPHSWRSLLTFKMAGIPQRVGHRGGMKGFLLTHKAIIRKEEWEGKFRPIPMDLYYLRLLEAIGKPYTDRKIELPITPQAEQYGMEYFQKLGLSSKDLVVAINPGAAFGSSKLWIPGYFAQAADALVERRKAKILFLCGPGEEKLVETIRQKMKEPSFFSPEIIPLNRLGAVVRQCKFMLSTDSGPRHFATAFDVPLVVLMGPIHPGYTALDSEKMAFAREPVECSPCHFKKCPIDHRCMVRLTPEKVLALVEDLMDRFVGG